MRKLIGMIAAAMLIAAPAMGQSRAEAQAMVNQARQQLAEAESSGMDASLLTMLKDMLAEAQRTLDGMDEDGAEAAAAAPTETTGAESPKPAYTAKDNVLAGSQACAGFTADNYRERGLAEGKDQQLRAMCAQAFDLYASYRRAIGQGYSEADANRTFSAHADAARVAEQFYAETRTD